MRQLCFRVSLPPWELSPNARPRPGAKWAAIRRYRYEGWAEAHAHWQRQVPMQRAHLRLTFVFCGQSPWDDDNCVAAFKSARDGLMDAGVIVDDGPRRISTTSSVEIHEHCRCGGSGVQVVVEEVD